MIVKQFFTALSYVFHPMLMPLLGLYLLFGIETRPLTYNSLDALCFFPDQAKYFMYVIVGILTFLAPMLSLLIMYWNRIIPSLHMEQKEQRIYPFVLVNFYYVLAYGYVRYQIPVELLHPALIGFLFGVLLVFVLSFLINFRFKISLHAVGIFGVTGMLVGYSQTQLSPAMGVTNLFVILYLLCVAGLVAGARVYLKAHTLSEVVLGAVLGFGVLFVTVKYGIYV